MSLVTSRISNDTAPDPRHDPALWLGRLVWGSRVADEWTAAALAGRTSDFLKLWRKSLPATGRIRSEGLWLSVVSDSPLCEAARRSDAFVSPDALEWLAGQLRTNGRKRRHASEDDRNPYRPPWSPPYLPEDPPSLNGTKGRKPTPLPTSEEFALGAKWVVRPLPESRLERLLLCDLILLHESRYKRRELWELWSAAVAGALRESGEWPPEADSDAEEAFDPLAGELLWKSGLLFEGIDAIDRGREQGRKRLAELLHRRTDDRGRPDADGLPTLLSDIGTLARATAWGTLFDRPLWEPEERQRLANWVQSAIAMVSSDGRVAFERRWTGEPAFDADTPVGGLTDALATVQRLAFAARASGLTPESRARASLIAVAEGLDTAAEISELALNRRQRRRLTQVRKEATRPSFQSDEGSLACLRNDWSPEADFVALAHHVSDPLLSITLAGVPMFRGSWEISVSVDGRELPLNPSWDSVCWFTDEDADYLELQQKLPEGPHLERQILLSRKGHYLLLADCVSGAEGMVMYRSRLPGIEGGVVAADVPTRECRLARGSITARAIPAALPCERLHSSSGALTAEDQGLTLEQSGANGLWAPLLIDWNPQRAEAAADWRTLTVSENGRKVAADRASGHRIRIGNHQLLIYRALQRGEGMRAVLGYHTGHETAIARLRKNGEYEPVLLVE